MTESKGFRVPVEHLDNNPPRDKGLRELDRQEGGEAAPFQARDRVRVTFDSYYMDVAIAMWHNTPLLQMAAIELLERADDPSRDEIGTVRREDYDAGHSIWQCVAHPTDPGETAWFCAYTTDPGNCGRRMDHADLCDVPVIGAVPGTPAAEAQAAELKEAEELAYPRAKAAEARQEAVGGDGA